MGIKRVGHLVIRMRNLEKAKHFYGDILGMRITDEREGVGVFFRFDDYHHDIGVFKVSDEAPGPLKDQVGLAHFALVVDNIIEVKALYRRLKDYEVPIIGTADHGITQSVYFEDPEGNEIEVYCDKPNTHWRDFDRIIKPPQPLDLEST